MSECVFISIINGGGGGLNESAIIGKGEASSRTYRDVFMYHQHCPVCQYNYYGTGGTELEKG